MSYVQFTDEEGMTMDTERASERPATDEEQQEEERSIWCAGKVRRKA
jgi:hypothetical protein